MAGTFNSLHDNDVFGNMADDDDDELGFNLDGSGFGADDDDESMKTSSASTSSNPAQADNGDNDLFDDDLPSDSEDADPYADPNDFFNAASDEEEESESATESKPEPAPKRRPGRPRKKQEPVAPQKQADPAPQPAQPDYSAYQQPQSDYPQQQDYNQQYAQPASSVQDYAQAYSAYQQPAQPDTSNPFADTSNQPAQPDYSAYQQPAQLEQPTAPVQQTTTAPVGQPSANTDSNAGMQSSASTWQSSTPMADMIRDNLSGDEKEAVKLVLNMGAIKYDELSEMVYAVLNARKSVMTALQELLQARGMEAATRVFYLIRLDDSDLGIIADIGAKFGSDVIVDKTQKEHYAITELADKAVSSMPDSSVNLLSAVLNVYNASKEIMNGR